MWKSSRQWRKWQIDDHELDSWDEWNDDGGQNDCACTLSLLTSPIHTLGPERENELEVNFNLAVGCEERRKRISLLREGMSKKSSPWTKDRRGWWTADRSTDGESQCSKEPQDSSHPRHPKPKGKEVKWVEKSTVLHEAGMMISEKRATWYKSSKETARNRFGNVGGLQRTR